MRITTASNGMRIALIPLILAGILIALFLASNRVPAAPEGAIAGLDYQTEASRMRAVFAAKGSAGAVADFRSSYRDYDEEVVHVLEHFLGEELYAREGTGGLVFCPASPLSGCYHGFFAKAFGEEGRSFIQLAETACRKRPDIMGANGCVHGIGHGLLSLEGRGNLLAALEDCGIISYSIPFGEKMCETGVFMEYNTESVHAPEGERIVPRPWDPERPYGPCTDIPSRHRAACYLQLPQWWGEVLENDFPRMASLCSGVAESENRENCFRSIGMVIVREKGRNVSAIRRHCGIMPDAQAEFFCVEEAAKLQRILGDRTALETCEILDEDGPAKCRKGVTDFLCQELGACDI